MVAGKGERAEAKFAFFSVGGPLTVGTGQAIEVQKCKNEGAQTRRVPQLTWTMGLGNLITHRSLCRLVDWASNLSLILTWHQIHNTMTPSNWNGPGCKSKPSVTLAIHASSSILNSTQGIVFLCLNGFLLQIQTQNPGCNSLGRLIKHPQLKYQKNPKRTKKYHEVLKQDQRVPISTKKSQPDPPANPPSASLLQFTHTPQPASSTQG